MDTGLNPLRSRYDIHNIACNSAGYKPLLCANLRNAAASFLYWFTVGTRLASDENCYVGAQISYRAVYCTGRVA